jgi:carbonic anhydrase
VAIVACMDHRLHPTAALGLDRGEAHVIRNAGGIVTDDVIRSVTISQRLLGTTEIALIHHTDCGMTKFADDEFRARLREETGAEPDWAPGAFADAEEDVRASIARIRESPFIEHKDAVRVYVFDVDSGELREVG